MVPRGAGAFREIEALRNLRVVADRDCHRTQYAWCWLWFCHPQSIAARAKTYSKSYGIRIVAVLPRVDHPAPNKVTITGFCEEKKTCFRLTASQALRLSMGRLHLQPFGLHRLSPYSSALRRLPTPKELQVKFRPHGPCHAVGVKDQQRGTKANMWLRITEKNLGPLLAREFSKQCF